MFQSNLVNAIDTDIISLIFCGFILCFTKCKCQYKNTQKVENNNVQI